MYNGKIVLTYEDAVIDCLILSKLILSIIDIGAVQNNGVGGYPYEAPHEKKRLSATHKLMDKYSYGWYLL